VLKVPFLYIKQPKIIFICLVQFPDEQDFHPGSLSKFCFLIPFFFKHSNSLMLLLQTGTEN